MSRKHAADTGRYMQIQTCVVPFDASPWGQSSQRPVGARYAPEMHPQRSADAAPCTGIQTCWPRVEIDCDAWMPESKYFQIQMKHSSSNDPTIKGTNDRNTYS